MVSQSVSRQWPYYSTRHKTNAQILPQQALISRRDITLRKEMLNCILYFVKYCRAYSTCSTLHLYFIAWEEMDGRGTACGKMWNVYVRKSTALLEVFQVLPVCLNWVWSIGGMIPTGETEVLGITKPVLVLLCHTDWPGTEAGSPRWQPKPWPEKRL